MLKFTVKIQSVIFVKCKNCQFKQNFCFSPTANVEGILKEKNKPSLTFATGKSFHPKVLGSCAVQTLKHVAYGCHNPATSKDFFSHGILTKGQSIISIQKVFGSKGLYSKGNCKCVGLHRNVFFKSLFGCLSCFFGISDLTRETPMSNLVGSPITST